MYVKAIDGYVKAYPYDVSNLMKDNPNTSFPEQMSDEILTRFNIYPVTPQEIPQPFDPITQNAVGTNPAFVDGKWIQTWKVTPATPNEKQERLDNLASDIRETRSAMLLQTDWTQVADAPVDKIVWATYRQALRDITKQSGFPTNVTWPIKPE
jgi:hypothetical protein